MDVGNEIARVELPAWLASDEHAVNMVAGGRFRRASAEPACGVYARRSRRAIASVDVGAITTLEWIQ